jgi:hypothetical protein
MHGAYDEFLMSFIIRLNYGVRVMKALRAIHMGMPSLVCHLNPLTGRWVCSRETVWAFIFGDD